MNPEKVAAVSALLERIQSTIEWKRAVDEKYGIATEEKEYPTPVVNDTIDDKTMFLQITEYLKVLMMQQRGSLTRFNDTIRITIRDPAAQDELLERFGGDKSFKEIFVEGCYEISDVGKEYKRLFKEAKALKKAK